MSRSILIALALTLAVVACDNPPETDAGMDEQDSGSDRVDAGPIEEDAGSTDEDAGSIDDDAGNDEDAGPDDTDAGAFDGGPFDAGPPDAGPRADGGPTSADAAVGTQCSFNRDCEASSVCDCAEFPCTCQLGTRGTGAVGTPCTDEDDCASAVCINENTTDSYCTDACTDTSVCGGVATECVFVSFVGMACAAPE